jgi:hypothetical protein
MGDDQDYEHIQLARPGPPDLGISFLKPRDWNLLPIPDEPPRFNEPNFFLPLAIAMAPFGAVLFTVGVRPAFEDGSVRQWVRFLSRENNVEILAGEDTSMAGFDGCLIDGKQASDMGPMRLRLFFFEDGKRLFQVGAVAPEQIWPSVENQLGFMARSFRTDEMLGQSMPVAPPPVEEPSPEPPAAAAPAEPEFEQVTDQAPTVTREVALADDAASLKQDHPMNARMRDNGIGLVPRVLAIDDSEKSATLAAAAVAATFKVPLGWHVMDDGKRTLIFDAGGKMQINLDRRRIEGSVPEMINAILADYASQNPDLMHLKLEIFGLQCIGFRNLRVDGELLEQIFLFRTSEAHPGTAVVARVTADSDHITFATNAAEVVLRDLNETPEIKDDWRQQVDTLEKLGQIEAAEELLLKSIDHLGAYSSAAYLWEKEVARRAAAGDDAGARQAAKRAADRLFQYAAGATSGGEGAALSLERDQRLEALKAYL